MRLVSNISCPVQIMLSTILNLLEAITMRNNSAVVYPVCANVYCYVRKQNLRFEVHVKPVFCTNDRPFEFQFDATLDVLSSVIVLWRYSNAAAVHSAHREYM